MTSSVLLAAATQQPDEVWSWLRTLVAALIGALVGGVFTLIAQSRTAANQLKAQEARDAVEAGRITAAWDRSESSQARADSLDEARRLHREFATLHGELQASDLTVSEIINRVNWDPRWRKIWTAERSLDLAVGTELLRDEAVRSRVTRVLNLLDNAENIAKDGWPGSIRIPLRRLVLSLTAMGTKLLAAYLRREPPPEDWDESYERLEENVRAFEEWQEAAIEAQAAAHEEEGAGREDEPPNPG